MKNPSYLLQLPVGALPQLLHSYPWRPRRPLHERRSGLQDRRDRDGDQRRGQDERHLRQGRPVIAAGPPFGRIKTALSKALKLVGRAGRVRQLLAGGYRTSFLGPSAGRLAIGWEHARRGRKVLIAMASIVCKSPGKAIVMIGLTSKGRNLLKNASKAVQMTAMGSFTPPGSTETTVVRVLRLRATGSGLVGSARCKVQTLLAAEDLLNDTKSHLEVAKPFAAASE